MVFTVFASLIVALFARQSDTAVIEGFVRTAMTELPIAGVEVNAIAAPPAARVQVTTDADGRFRLVVRPGQYQVFATKQGYSSPVSRPLEPTTAMRITALAGQRASANFQLLPTGTVTGRVFDPEGRPMEGVSVALSRLSWTGDGRRMLQPISFGARASATTNDLAEYRLYWIPAGDYYLSARDRSGALTTSALGLPQKYVTTYYPGVADPNDAATLHVPAGVELGGINLSLSRVHSTAVHGRVVSPVADVADSVTIVNMAPIDESIVVDPVQVNFNYVSKTFVADNILPGRYRIIATLRIPNKFNLSGEVIVNVAEEPLENVIVSVTPSQRITGQLRVEDSSPAVREALEAGTLHVNLRASPNAAFLSGSTEVRKDGAFVLNDVGVVQYRAEVFGLPPDAYIVSARLGGADILEKGFTLRGESPGPMDITVSGLGGRIAGVVRSPQNEIVPSGRVVLVPEAALRGRTDLFKVATLDQYGRFNIQGITPGRYKLFAWDDVPVGAYFDSEFLRPFEDQAKAVTVEKNDYIQAQITLIQRVQKIGELSAR
jgi:hypothetical protein